MSGVCGWVTDSCAGESESQSLAQAAIRGPLSHQGQTSEEISSTSYCRKINDAIFELHAPTSARAEMEILFFHGLQLEGTSDLHISTWRSRSAQKAVWPGQWLPKDFPKARILSVSYDASLTRDATSGRMDMHLVAENLLYNCLLAKLGQVSPLILVGHCFGGLVIKQMCVFAHSYAHRTDSEAKTFFESVRGIFYFATPHRGTHFTSAIEKLSSKEGDLLSHVKVLSKDLARLDADFNRIPRQWLVSGLGEALPTKLGSEFNDVVVEEGSARCENFCIVPENHISICRPESRNSTTYQHLCKFIGRVQQKLSGEPHSYPVSTEPHNYPVSTIRGCQTYVPIHTQARDSIISGLENEQGPAVILLHGEPGSGKSVLARFIGESYARSYGGAADSGSIFCSVPPISPKLVIFLECGQTAVSTQLLQKLHEKLHLQVHRSPDQCGNGSRCTLPFLMMGRRIIVVLDDVWNSEVIEVFLEEKRGCPGAHIKILVTSRRSDLSDDPEILKVKTEEVTSTQAENILASHLGLPSIPQNLQKVAGILVEKSGSHPLSLAMVACRITRDRKEDPIQWKAVADSYTSLLRQELQDVLVRQGKQVMSFGSVLHCPYRRSIGETLMLTYKDLKPDSKYLLLLVGKSGPSSVPSPVVRVLFAYGVANHHKYSQPELLRFALNDLENNGAMLRLSKMILDGSMLRDVPCNSASFGYEQFSYEFLGLHDLQKEFLSVLMEEDNERLEESLVSDIHCSVPLEDFGKMTSEELDRATVWILCIMWLREDLAERAAKKLGVSLPLFGSLSIPVLKDALEPLTWLMHEAFGEEMSRCAKQVMVLCFLSGEFRKALLEVPDIVPRLVKLLLNSSDDYHLCHVSDTLITLSRNDVNQGSTVLRPWEINLDVLHQIGRTPGVIPKLLTILSSESPLQLRFNSCSLLISLTLEQDISKALLEVPDTVAQLVKLLVNSGDDNLSGNVVGILFNLSRKNPDIQHQVGGSPGLIRKLMTILSSPEDPPNNQRNAAVLLHGLSYIQDNRQALLEVPETVAQLVKLLVNSGDDNLSSDVAGILIYLSWKNPDIQHQVGGSPGLIRKLMAILSSPEDPPNNQRNAAGLLHALSDIQDNRQALLEVPDTVAQLVKLLVNSGDDNLSDNVVGILFNLSRKNPDIQHQVGGSPGLIRKLMTILSSPEDPPNNQRNAAVLLNVLSDIQDNRQALLEVPDTVAQLVKLLVNSGDDNLSSDVARILFNLSWKNPDIQHQVGGSPGLIRKLMAILSSPEDPPNNQRNAAGLLHALSDIQDNRQALLEVPDTVAQLVKLLVNSGDDNLSSDVAGILFNLSWKNPDIQHQVGGSPGLIRKLMAILSSPEDPPNNQRNAAGLLHVLSDIQDNRQALLEVPDTVAQLVKLLVNSDDDNLSSDVAGILIYLSWKNPDIQHQVGGSPGLIRKLMAILSSPEDPPNNQRNAAGLLHVLSDIQDNRQALLEVPDTVAQLVKLLVNSDDDNLSSDVAGILIYLSWKNPDIQHQVGGSPGLIRKLMAILSSPEDPPNNQRNAAGLLHGLSDIQDNRQALLEVPDTVAQLVKLLVNSGDDNLSGDVATILFNLSLKNPDIQHQVGGSPGLIRKLMTILSSPEDPPNNQRNAAGLLHVLSDIQDNRQALLEVPDTVAQLVKLLVNSDDDNLSSDVAGILIYLSWKNPDIQHQVRGSPGLIHKLMTIPSSENPPTLRRNASTLLNMLRPLPQHPHREGGCHVS